MPTLSEEANPCDALLTEMDAIYKEFEETKHQALWGGSWEREESARNALKPIANKLFGVLLRFMEARQIAYEKRD